jgi:hypothetical protein
LHTGNTTPLNEMSVARQLCSSGSVTVFLKVAAPPEPLR